MFFSRKLKERTCSDVRFVPTGLAEPGPSQHDLSPRPAELSNPLLAANQTDPKRLFRRSTRIFARIDTSPVATITNG